MKALTTCCHVCRTSLTINKRKYLRCSSVHCNKVVCKNCFGTKIPKLWKDAKEKNGSYLCPACDHSCPCQRCNQVQVKNSIKDVSVMSSGPLVNFQISNFKNQNHPTINSENLKNLADSAACGTNESDMEQPGGCKPLISSNPRKRKRPNIPIKNEEEEFLDMPVPLIKDRLYELDMIEESLGFKIQEVEKLLQRMKEEKEETITKRYELNNVTIVEVDAAPVES